MSIYIYVSYTILISIYPMRSHYSITYRNIIISGFMKPLITANHKPPTNQLHILHQITINHHFPTFFLPKITIFWAFSDGFPHIFPCLPHRPLRSVAPWDFSGGAGRNRRPRREFPQGKVAWTQGQGQMDMVRVLQWLIEKFMISIHFIAFL